MNTHTDTQLKQALAKMLPDKLQYARVLITLDEDKGYTRPVLDTELLHLCWLVEDNMSSTEALRFMRYLIPDEDVVESNVASNLNQWQCTHATWQQRVVALAKVRGVEIV